MSPDREPSALKVMAGRLAGRLLPKFQLKNKLPAEELTRDPEVMKSLENDPLLWSTGTLEGLAGLLDRAADLSAGRRTLNPGVKSLWLAHGTVDGGTSYPASKKWFEASTSDVPDKEHKTYEGWQHQLHADLPETRPVFAKDVGDWILARVEAPKDNAKPAATEAVVEDSSTAAPAVTETAEGGSKGAAKL
jgi:acylglycerol lipase